MKEKLICSHCGAEIEGNDYNLVDGEIVCQECIDDHTVTCEHCGRIIWDSDDFGNEDMSLCRSCYENHYTHCAECNRLIYNDDTYEYDGDSFCYECYREVRENSIIHDYSYKPNPIFYGDSDRYFGIELEIDKGGKDDDYAGEILDIANKNGEYIYIKSDGSLDEGMEIVSHPMTLDFHKNYCWNEIMRKAIQLGYRSHQTSTCGLHIHVNRTSFGESREDQDDVISRILFFVESHWNELLKFSRRTEYNINRWAARYGYENSAKDILDKAKNGNQGRYAAVNLCNYNTIEFRMFRGTLKYSTFIACLELVNIICETAVFSSEDELKKLSWSEFVSKIKDAPELIQYLKERRLYINETTETEEEF